MAETNITPVALTIDTVSADITDADGVVATTPGDGFNILAGGRHGDRLLLKFLADGSGDTVTIVAGANPPAARAGLGSLDVVLAASDVRYIAVEAARFLRADGTILATCSDAGTKASGFILPRG